MNPSQRASRYDLAQLDELAITIVGPPVVEPSGDPYAVWAVAEAHRAQVAPKVRSALGIFYTPPGIAERLIDDLAEVGARFDGTQSFCDPACGGGAFLLPVARRIAVSIFRAGGTASDLARLLVGMDVDPVGVNAG